MTRSSPVATTPVVYRRSSAHATPSTARTRSSVSSGSDRDRHVHGAHAGLGDEHVGGGVVDVGGHLTHRAGEDTVEHEHEDQRGGDAEHRQRRATAVLEEVPAGERDAAVAMSASPIGGRRVEAGEAARRDDGGDEAHGERDCDRSDDDGGGEHDGELRADRPMISRGRR